MKRLIVLPLIILVAVSLACQIMPGAASAAPTPTNAPVVSQSEQVLPTEVVATLVPTPTAEPTSSKPMPVDTKTAANGNYHEEFDGATPNWKFDYITGNTQKDAEVATQDGILKVKLAVVGREETHLKLIETEHTYSDVTVSTQFENFGATHNGIGVICRVNKDGWYEFHIESGGLWKIERYDASLKAANKVPYVAIAEGGSKFISAGINKKNTIAMACIGDQFRFFINDQELTNNIMRIPPTKLDEFKKYSQGTTGLAVYSWGDTATPVEVHFEYFDTKVPQQ